MQPVFRSLLSESGASSSWMFACVPSMLQTHVLGRLQRMEGDVATLNDILGRLAHDLGDPESSIEYVIVLSRLVLSRLVRGLIN